MNDFFDFSIEDFLEDYEQELMFIMAPEIAEALAKAVSSAEAQAFTKKMNEQYEDNNDLNEDGSPKRIETPVDLMNRMAPNNDGTVRFVMSQEEDMWFKANKLFGDDILGKLGFEYIIED